MYKLAELLRLDQKILHASDLGKLWGHSNQASLYTAINRYVKKGILIPIQKGLYATIPLDKIDPIKLGMAVIHNYAYLSCETVLAKAGLIFQSVQTITLISLRPRKFEIGNNRYLVRQLNPKFLYQTAGMDDRAGYLEAGPERAVADMLYFNPRYHFDGADRIDWKRVKLIQTEVGYI